jgi:quinol monooxygenase YgiN
LSRAAFIVPRAKFLHPTTDTFLGEIYMADVKLGLWVRLEARAGKENEVENFLKSGQALVDDEPETTAWFAIRMNQSTFGIFDVFQNEQGRQAHLAGRVAEALMAKASDLLASPPAIEKIDVIAAKLPEPNVAESAA